MENGNTGGNLHANVFCLMNAAENWDRGQRGKERSKWERRK